MNKKIKKLKLGALMSLPIVSLPFVVSMTNLYKDNEEKRNEYISIVIGDEEMTFENTKQAVDYIVRNKINVDQKVMVGEPQYLDKNKGILNPDSLTEYVGDKEHVAPAYKMMNGEYTMDRNKAIKSFLGRSHLVSQYYDNNGNYYEGNVSGLQKAKDSILSRQKEGIAPYYKVNLGGNNNLNINPFNEKDVDQLKTKVKDLYKKRVDKKVVDKNGPLSEMYLLPGLYGSKIGVIPSDPARGLQMSDLVATKPIKEMIKEKIRFKFVVEMNSATSSSSPSKSNSNPYEFIAPTEWNDHKWHFIDKTNYDTLQIKFSSDGKKIELKGIPFKYLQGNEGDFNSFMYQENFWNKYTPETKSGKTDWFEYPDAKNQTIFGKKIEIRNYNSDLSWGHSGFDVSLNSDKGTVYQFTTWSSLNVDKDYWKEEDFEGWIKNQTNSLSSKFKLDKKIRDELAKNYINNELYKIGFENKNKDIKTTQENIKKLKEKIYGKQKKDPVYGFWYKGSGDIGNLSWGGYTYGNDLDDKNSITKVWENNFLKKVHENASSTPLNLQGIDYKKILLLNNSPIEEIRSDDPKKIIENSDMIKNIKTEYSNGKFHYTYKNQWKDPTTNQSYNSYWEYATREFGSSQDFMKKNSFAGNKPIELSQNSWVQFRKNKLYNEKKNNTSDLKRIPWLMASPQNGGYAPIKLAKILVGKTDEVYSLYKKDPSELFKNNTDINTRKDQISKDFFEPQLVYVIYNDNDEIITEFASGDSSLKFDDKETVKHNARAVLSKYLKKDIHKIFVKDSNNKWTHKPISNKLIMVYNLYWNDKLHLFESFEQINSFITEWVQTNSRKIVIG